MTNYGDGNGNQHIIEQGSTEYNPIKPKFSSSGIYNGGDHVKKKITQQQYNKIASIFKEAIAYKASPIKNRVKMSGVITILRRVFYKKNKSIIILYLTNFVTIPKSKYLLSFMVILLF